MESVKNLAVTVVLGLMVLAGLDIVFNGGQTLAVLMPERTAPSTSSGQAPTSSGQAVGEPDPGNGSQQNYVVIPTRASSIVIDTSQPATVIFVEPEFVTATPAPTATGLGTASSETETIMIPMPTQTPEGRTPGCGRRGCLRPTATAAPGR